MATPVNRDEIAADWHRRGFSCGLWVDAPGQVWANFVHDVDELVMVVEGELELDIAGATVIARPGEEHFVPAGADHTVKNTGGTMARWLYGYRRS